jgi:hypothetical protein
MAATELRSLDTGALLPRYLVALGTAAVAGAVGAAILVTVLHSARPDLDGTSFAVPALFGAAAVAMAVLAIAATRLARQVDAETVTRIVRHVLWFAFVLALVPGVAWIALWASGGSARALLGLVGVALASLPLAVAYRRPSALPGALGVCLAVAVVTLVLWQRFFLLLPDAVLLAGCWAIALGLWRKAKRLT